ncbi:MAG: SIS domain-containing protein [Streptosporangiales bacterium]|nr:SIS domain-containing protein [Streptosporangiales bacterium]
MRAEIEEQPAALRATLDALLPLLPDVASVARGTRQVLFIARGSSDNAAVYGRYLVEVCCGRLGSLASPSVATTYGGRLDLDGVLAVGLSQSGRTREIVETLGWAAECGARTVAVSNVAASPLAEVAELALITEAGEEVAVPATKTYTTQLAALAVLALAMCPGDEVDRLVAELRHAPDEVEGALATAAAAEELADELTAVTGAVVSGRGFGFSAALELALKLKEACYLHAIGLSYADLLHGPIAVVDEDTPAILVAPASGPTLSGMVAVAERVTGAGAKAYGIGGDGRLATACTRTLPGTGLPEWLAPLGLVVPAQLLTEALARRLDIDPDLPRGLGKVTQTDLFGDKQEDINGRSGGAYPRRARGSGQRDRDRAVHHPAPYRST